MNTQPCVQNNVKRERESFAILDPTDAMSVYRLAKMVGVTRQQISRIEQHQCNPSIGVALKIAQALQVSVEDLFFLEDEQ